MFFKDVKVARTLADVARDEKAAAEKSAADKAASEKKQNDKGETK
jgi:translation initiation factor IF-2